MSYDPATTSSTYGSTTYESHNGSHEQPHGGGVRDQARQVGSEAAQAGGAIAQTAREQGREVVGEATRQARNLYGEARTQLHSQAGDQQRRAASGLRSLADEMRSMAQQGGQAGPVTELAHQAAERVHGVAGWLEQREPGDLVNEVRDYARRNPGTFLVGAAVLGVLAGRLTRNIAAGGDGQHPGTGHRAYDPEATMPVVDPDRTAVLPPASYAAPDPGYADPLAGGYTGAPSPGGYADPLPPTGTGQPLPPATRTDPLPGVPSSGVTRP